MTAWTQALSLAVLAAAIPLAVVWRVFQRNLPSPLLLSYRRLPAWANSAVISGVTLDTAVFLRLAAGNGGREPIELALLFLIAALVYVFGVVLLVRQFAGLYPEYFVSTGRIGFGVRKGLYRNVVDIDASETTGAESRVRIRMRSGEDLHLVLPREGVPVLFEAVRKSRPDL